MALFSKKKKEDDILPPIPETEELQDLPPLPGEEEFAMPEPLPKMPRMKAQEMRPMPEEEISRPAYPMSMPSMQPFPPSVSAPTGAATVFVRIDKYKDVMSTVDLIESKLEELKSTLNAIAAIKGKEAEIIDGWNAMLQQTKAKVDEVNTKLSRPQD